MVISQCVILNAQFRSDSFGSLEREAARTHSQPPEAHPLRLGQQGITPIDRRAQRLLTRRAVAARREQAEAVVEMRHDRFYSHMPDARSGKLDRQWNAI